ncbi:MAG: LysE family translocator [Oleiphilaceae bacterium]|nr:LysE family translocator [Oleiphilaceae bacterium]
MFELEWLAGFVVASGLLILSPGPDNLYVVAQSARNGLSSGIWLTLGLCSGLLGHTLAVVMGVAVFIQSSPLAFVALKMLGAGYLIYLAWQLWRSNNTENPAQQAPTLHARQLYWRGVVMNLSNPKVTLFFLAFLPQFTQADTAPIGVQLTLLGLLFALLALVMFSSFAWLASRRGLRHLLSAKKQILMERLLGVIFVALALRLLWFEAL